MSFASRTRPRNRARAAAGALVLGSALAVPIASCSRDTTGGAGVASTNRVAAAYLAATHLRVDQSFTPLGIDDRRPSLSWRLESQVPDTRQSEYQLLVASAPDRLVPGLADVWDSGVVASNASVGIAYGGPALQSTRRYYWTVQVRDTQGELSPWAPASWWEMGLLDASDWRGAQWIRPDVAGPSWSNVTVDVDFTIRRSVASLVFRAQDSNNLYLWQVNGAVSPGKVSLRPHLERDGAFSHLAADVDISALITPENLHQPHHLRVTTEGATIRTWIDGTLVNTLVDATFGDGTVGFRVGADDEQNTRYDNLAVRGLDGTSLFSDDFSISPDSSFPGTNITDGQLEPGSGITLLNRDPSAPMLRHEFTLGKPIARARAYVDGLGFYELHLNGQKVGDRVLTPANTPYARRALYDTYDVTDHLRSGANAVGMWLGNGHGPQFSRYGFRWMGPKQALVLIVVTYDDGTEQTITTGGDWSWMNGPLVTNDIYGGETYDARLEPRGWDRPGFSSSSSPNAVIVVPGPTATLTANDLPPPRVVQTLQPVRLTEPKPGVYVYDLGQNIAGWQQLRVSGPAGTTVQMRTAEELGADGMLDTYTNRSAACTDRFTLAGTGQLETYEPRFTYHGFRYVEVTGYPGIPTMDAIRGRVVHADVASTGTFHSSDPLLNRIWQNARWTVLNDTLTLPTDNPVRDERTPPGMDVQAYHDFSIREFDMDRFYAGYLLTLPPGTALPTDDATRQYPDMGGNPISLAWHLYEQYGDKAALVQAYPAMKTFVDTNAANVPSHIWPANQGFGDWCPPVYGPGVNDGRGSPGIGNCSSEVSLVNTALSYLQASNLARAADALGYAEDAARYTALAANIKTAFNGAFLNAGRNGYGSGRQTTSILPLAFGLVPDGDLESVGNQLVNTILQTNQGHLDTGIFGTRYLVDALARIGRVDVAMTVLAQTTYPSFGYQISQGATSTWEQWTFTSNMETHDHAMFAGIAASLYTVLGGIVPSSPGYATIHIAPQVPPTLQHACTTLDTVRGTVKSCWAQNEGSFDLEVTIPANATATVSVPLFGRAPNMAHARPGATPLRVENGSAIYAIGSGNWQFATRLKERRD